MNTINVYQLQKDAINADHKWVIIKTDALQGAYASRAAAREANKEFQGKVVNVADVQFNIVQDAPAPVVAETPAAEPKAKTPKIPVTRESTIERPCKQVWHIADAMAEKAGGFKNLRRKDVLAYCVANGIAFYTARTQYQLWLTIQNGGSI